MKHSLTVLVFALLISVNLLPPFKICPVRSDPATITVPDDFPKLQEAIDAANAGDTIFVRNGTYDEQLFVGKTLALIGEGASNTVITVGVDAEAAFSIAANNVTVSGFDIKGGTYGIKIQNSCFTNISMNIVENDARSIFVYESLDCTISHNMIRRNCYGIWVSFSEFITISDNNITEAWGVNPTEGYGIWLFWSSLNTISNNLVSSNIYGIKLDDQSTFNNVLGNTISNNYGYGIWLYWAGGNSIYHNNFVNNVIQAYTEGNTLNKWNNTCEGNYWSDYTGVDNCSGPYQNETGSDGIGDTPYIIETYLSPGALDNYPLMNPWSPPDIAVTNLTTSKTVIGQGYTGSVSVTFENLGNKIEAFNATVCVNRTSIDSEALILTTGNSTIIGSDWNTSDFAYGNYALSASASILEGDTNITNNFNGGWLVVTISGDIDGDFNVNLGDLVLLSNAYGTSPRQLIKGSCVWNPNADIDGDGKVDLGDLVRMSNNYRQHYP